MKYIKSHKIFESISEELEDLKDICLEMEDDGFNVSFNSSLDDVDRHLLGFDGIQIIISNHVTWSHQNTQFEYSKISETLERIISYIVPLGYNYNIEFWRQKFTGGYWCSKKRKSIDGRDEIDESDKCLSYKMKIYTGL